MLKLIHAVILPCHFLILKPISNSDIVEKCKFREFSCLPWKIVLLGLSTFINGNALSLPALHFHVEIACCIYLFTCLWVSIYATFACLFSVWSPQLLAQVFLASNIVYGKKKLNYECVQRYRFGGLCGGTKNWTQSFYV